ncbi:MAG: glycoside hydrolase family 44 protein [Candidatus Eisenbacteria bacterium]
MTRAPLLTSSLAISALLVAAISAHAATLTVYDDALRNSFQDWSWAGHSLTESTTKHSGTYSISMHATNWEGLFFHLAGGFAVSELDTLEFWVNGGDAAGKDIGLVLQMNGANRGSVVLDAYVQGGQIPGGAWALARVPFSACGVTNGSVDGLIFQAWGAADQHTLYFDDLVLRGPGAPTGPITINVDPSLDRHAISQEIYGVNLGSSADFAAAPYPVRRWGGNQTSRYSYQDDTVNSGFDWFYMNSPLDNPNPGNLPNGGAVDRFVQETKAVGAKPLVTMPTIGWVAKDRVKRWGFSIAKYGAQQDNECIRSGWQSWCAEDAGNGVRPNGTKITGNDPLDTSRTIGPSHDIGWMQHLTSYTGGVPYYALDNECMLWHETHRDVHPAKLTYDELWSRTASYASAMKTQDASAKLFGPVTWGWCDLYNSAADDCVAGADRAAHGGTPLVEWYLAQVATYQQQHGVRLIDYLDLHYYPQGSGVALSDDESAGTSALRLRSLRELYDPSYVSESWINQPVALIPMVKAWIAAHTPGMKLAITEYNWGNDDGLSSTLAQAEALAIFGREGVDVATRWVAPEVGTRMVDAFRFFLNYDGAGAQVSGESVRATTSDLNRVTVYGVRGDGSRLFVLLFNQSTAAQTVNVTVNGGLSGNLALYRFDGAQSLGPAGSITPSGSTFAATLPARSATLAVGTRAASPVDSPIVMASTPLFHGARPSPFRGSTFFAFELPRREAVTLEIFDAAGRRVRTLVDRAEYEAGPSSFYWDGRADGGRDVAAGVLFARLSGHGWARSHMLILLD